jgi:hypothetical protein
MTFRIIQILLLLNGLGIGVIWTRDILTHPEIDYSGGFFSARDNKSATLFWPHWLAEYSTALLLVVSPVLIFFKVDYGNQLLPFAAGALFYTALNSLGWAFAGKERFVYAVPMLFALATSFIYFFFLILS